MIFYLESGVLTSALTAQPMRLDERFRAAYRDLEKRMRARAVADGDIYLPNPQPEGPVHHMLSRPWPMGAFRR